MRSVCGRLNCGIDDQWNGDNVILSVQRLSYAPESHVVYVYMIQKHKQCQCISARMAYTDCGVGFVCVCVYCLGTWVQDCSCIFPFWTKEGLSVVCCEGDRTHDTYCTFCAQLFSVQSGAMQYFFQLMGFCAPRFIEVICRCANGCGCSKISAACNLYICAVRASTKCTKQCRWISSETRSHCFISCGRDLKKGEKFGHRGGVLCSHPSRNGIPVPSRMTPLLTCWHSLLQVLAKGAGRWTCSGHLAPEYGQMAVLGRMAPESAAINSSVLGMGC